MTRIIITFILFSACFSIHAQTKNFIDQSYLEVKGYADTLVTPDQIYIRIHLSEKDTRDRVSLEDQEIKLVNALKLAGINTETALAITDMSSNFRIYILKSRDVLKSKQYFLIVKDAATATKVFLQLEEASISNASIERVAHSQVDLIRNVMRSKAISNAKDKAVALTKPLSQTVGNALHIEDQDMSASDQALQGRNPGMMLSGYNFDKNKGELPKIEFDRIKVSSGVSAKFALK